MVFTEKQMHALTASERFMSILSILGSAIIISSFLYSSIFRKPVTRLIFAATLGNILTNVATLISTSALPGPGSGLTPLCEFQGILIQWFMMADSHWVLAMAINVQLVFYQKWKQEELRKLEPWYALVCYGLPGTIAIIYIILDHTLTKPVIGPATIWCWVSKDVEWLRIAFFYGPVWLCCFASMCIYLSIGWYILKRRNDFKSIGDPNVNSVINLFDNQSWNNIEKKTDITVVSRTADTELGPISPSCIVDPRKSRIDSIDPVDTAPITPPPTANSRITSSRLSRFNFEGNTTSEAHGHDENLTNTYSVNISAAKGSTDTKAVTSRPTTAKSSKSFKLARPTVVFNSNKGKEQFYRISCLMFVALLVVWAPSTANRVQQYAQGGKPLFALNLASAIVLPSQGLWNCLIYIYTLRSELKQMKRDGFFSSLRRNRQVNDRRRSSERTVMQSHDEELGLDPDAEVTVEAMIMVSSKSSVRDDSNFE